MFPCNAPEKHTPGSATLLRQVVNIAYKLELTIGRAEVLRVHRSVQHSIPQPAAISVKKDKTLVKKENLHTFLYILLSLLHWLYFVSLSVRMKLTAMTTVTYTPIQAHVCHQQTFTKASFGFFSGLR